MTTDPHATILDRLRDDLRGIRSGRATPVLIEGLLVEAYNSRLTLKELATITAPEPRQLLVQPWDQSQIKAIETALRQSDLGLLVAVDRDRLRVSLPQLTEERRKEYLKLARERAEHARIAIRRHRDDVLKGVRDEERAGTRSEDDAERERKTVDADAKDANESIRQLLEQKEQELLTI